MKRSNTLLIRTKLMPSRVDERALRRDRLLTLLEANKARLLTLIVGPAGSGKTTLAVQWRQVLIASGCDVGWYCLGPGDESQWSAYMVASLENAGLSITNEMVSLGELAGKRALTVLLPLLVNALYEHSRPVYLFLEDLHLLTDAQAQEFIQALIELAPDNFHLVICARQLPELDLASLGIKGQLTRIGYSELRLSFDEQVDMLIQQGVSELTKTQHRRLYRLTDGWAAGLQLISLSLKSSGGFNDSFESWTRTTNVSEPYGIDAYLDDCIARVLTPEQISVMVHLSVCRRVNRELCAALMGDSEHAAAFDVLLKQNLFLLPIELEGDVQWYRFHQMFAGYLAKLQAKLPPEEIEQLNRRASHWFVSRKMYIEAIHHAQYAGDVAESVELLTRAARKLIAGAHYVQLVRMVYAVPRESWSGKLDLLLAVGWAELSCHRLNEFQLTFDSILAHPDVKLPSVQVEVRLMRAFSQYKRDDTQAVLELLDPLLKDPPYQNNYQLLTLYLVTGLALLKANRAVQVRDLTNDAQRILAQAQGTRPRPFLDALRGLSFYVQGDLRQAKRQLMSALASISRAPMLAPQAPILVKTTLALTLYEMDDLDAAENYMEECIGVAEELGTFDSILYTYVARARLQCAGGMPDAAYETLEQLGELAKGVGLDRLHAWRYAEQVRIAYLYGDLSLAREAMRCLHALARPYADKKDCAWAEIPLMVGMAESALALADGDYRSAAAIAERWLQVCQESGQALTATIMRIRAAIAHAALNAPALVEHHILEALRTASEFGMNRVFLDEGPAGLKLLESLSPDQLRTREQEYRKRCLKRASTVESAPEEVESQLSAGAGLLSPREQEIINLLGKALSTKSVARELNVSPGTIKWHLKNIFGKLNALSREDAVAKARKLGLLT